MRQEERKGREEIREERIEKGVLRDVWQRERETKGGQVLVNRWRTEGEEVHGRVKVFVDRMQLQGIGDKDERRE